MKTEISVLASGSSGNSIYIRRGRTKLLIDAGLSGKQIAGRMKCIERTMDEIDGILVTHEHRDHIKGVGVLSRRFDIPIYANELTWQGAGEGLGKIESRNCKIIDGDFMVGDMGIEPFSIPHDALDPVGYIINCGRARIGIATDMGTVTARIKEKITGLDFLILEANHDLDMLLNGDYPRSLKNRIRGKNGHLSNDAAAALLPEVVGGNRPGILLAHLSKDNNIPRLAYITIKNNLEKCGYRVGKDLDIGFTFREKPTELYNIDV